MGVIFLQKFYEFTTRSDDSIFGQFFVKFLTKNLVTSLDFAVVCWFCRPFTVTFSARNKCQRQVSYFKNELEKNQKSSPHERA